MEVANVPKRRKRRDRGQDDVKVSKFQVCSIIQQNVLLSLKSAILIIYLYFAGSQDLCAESVADYFSIDNRRSWIVPVVEGYIPAF